MPSPDFVPPVMIDEEQSPVERWARAASATLRRWILGGLRGIRSARAELLTAFCLVAGWALMTDAVARVTAPLAWRFSVALFLLSLVGWRLLWALASRGLYVLTRKRDE